jgi:secreted Zn-dependent insulinase-like peptidase
MASCFSEVSRCSGFKQAVGFVFFYVEVDLTCKGLHAAPGLGMAVTQLVFDYIAMLKVNGPKQWMWLQMKALHEHNFRSASGSLHSCVQCV